jgi:prephenate dehydrogenase
LKAVVIGAEGKMGRWLVHHLAGQGYTVHPVDLRRGEEERKLGAADLVVVSVPIRATPEVLYEAISHMKPGAVLAEIASLKEGVVEPLRASADKGLVPLCLHPMFGPSTVRLDNEKVALVPLVDPRREAELAETLFPGADLVAVDAEAHDKYMAAVLSLPYLVNMAFAKALEGMDLEKLRRLGGTTYTLQYILAQSVVSEKTGLVEPLLSQNRHLERVQKGFLEAMKQVAVSVEEGGFTKVHADTRRIVEADPSYIYADESRRRAYDAVKDHGFKNMGSHD